jgi:uncharacterized protein YprB with RNaseH-like and TPR domain
MRLVEQVRKSLGLDARPADPAPAPAPAPDSIHPPPANVELLQRLRREVQRIQRRDPPPVPRPEPQPAPAQLPPTDDPEGLRYARVFAPGHGFGRHRVSPPASEDLAAIGRLLALELGDRAPRDLQPHQLLFLDLETTGLSRSASTLAFITGLGSWQPAGQGGGFEVQQILLHDPQQEGRTLELLAERLQRARLLVTFNGRAFDVPILRNRGVLNRVRLTLDLPHLDLLPPCRRLFRPRLANCRQVTLERSLIGFARQGDVPGSEAPRIYADFLRTGSAGELCGVLEHNCLDVALMAPILLLLARHAADPLHWGEDAEELLGAGLMHLQAGTAETGESCLCRALELGGTPATRRRLLVALARHLRRQGRVEEARKHWERYRSEFPEHNTGWVELAKYHEHVSRDLPRALDLARRAPRPHLDQLHHRLARLRRRVDRLSE